MKLCKIIARTDDEFGINFKILKVDYEEKEKTYKVISKNIISEQFINKERLLVEDTIFTNIKHPLSYFTFCLENDVVEAEELLEETIKFRINLIKKESDKLQHIFKLYELNK